MRETRLYTIRRRAARKQAERKTYLAICRLVDQQYLLNMQYGKFAYDGGRTETVKPETVTYEEAMRRLDVSRKQMNEMGAMHKPQMSSLYGRKETLLERLIRKMRINSEY